MASSRASAASALTPKQLADLRDKFNLFDVDRSNSITLDEFADVLRAMGLNPSEKVLRKAFAEADRDGNAALSFDEFVRFAQPIVRAHKPEPLHKQLRDAFQAMDRDGSGKISLKEFKRIMLSEGEPLTSDELADMLARYSRADVNDDGELNFAEFVSMMTGEDAQPVPNDVLAAHVAAKKKGPPQAAAVRPALVPQLQQAPVTMAQLPIAQGPVAAHPGVSSQQQQKQQQQVVGGGDDGYTLDETGRSRWCPSTMGGDHAFNENGLCMRCGQKAPGEPAGSRSSSRSGSRKGVRGRKSRSSSSSSSSRSYSNKSK